MPVDLPGNRSGEPPSLRCARVIRSQIRFRGRRAFAWRLPRKQFPDVDNVTRLEDRRLGRLDDNPIPVAGARDADRAFHTDLNYAAGVLQFDVADLTSR